DGVNIRVHVKPSRIGCLVHNVCVRGSMHAAIVSDRQNTGRSRYKSECVLIHVHGTWVTAGITTGYIVPDCPCPRCKPDVEGVKEHAVGIVRIHRDALVVPVLRIIASTGNDVDRTALGALHKTPSPATVCGSPSAKLAAVGVATPAIAIENNGLPLRVDVIWVTRRDCDVDASELVGAATTGSGPTSNGIVARRAGAGVHRRTRRVRTAGDLIAKDESISIAGN